MRKCIIRAIEVCDRTLRLSAVPVAAQKHCRRKVTAVCDQSSFCWGTAVHVIRVNRGMGTHLGNVVTSARLVSIGSAVPVQAGSKFGFPIGRTYGPHNICITQCSYQPNMCSKHASWNCRNYVSCQFCIFREILTQIKIYK